MQQPYHVVWSKWCVVRIVLDEAQIAKNVNTRYSHAVWKLTGRRRWCLSGTPVQNSIRDLLSYFRFLNYEPYCNPTSFDKFIKSKISKDSVKGFECLRAILKVKETHTLLLSLHFTVHHRSWFPCDFREYCSEEPRTHASMESLLSLFPAELYALRKKTWMR